jgi:glycerophosphoryl diester phosphodiesterase
VTGLLRLEASGSERGEYASACHAESILAESSEAAWFARSNPIGVVGHRGSLATHRENSIAAFQHAIACRADAVELDVVFTTDRELVVSHDPVNCGVRDLSPYVPRLDAVLALGEGNGVVFDIEAKECGALTPAPSEFARRIFDCVDRAGMAHRVALRSFEHSVLRAAHELRPEIPLVALTAHRAKDWVGMAARAHARCVSPHFRLVSSREVAQAREAGIVVMPWTVNKPRAWERLIAVGVEWIITDDPAALVQYLRKRTGVTDEEA